MIPIVTIARPMRTAPLTRLIRAHPLTAYFVLAFACMWLPVLPLALSRNAGVGLLPYDLPSVLMNGLLALTVISGPTLAALLVTGLTEGRSGVKQLLKRCIQWRVGLGWYGVALFLILSVWLLAYTAIVGLPLVIGAITHWPLLLTTFLPLVAFGLVIPAIDEEPGWRGYALPRLQQRYGPLWASVILGTLHGLWHIPALLTVLFGPLPLADIAPFVLTNLFATVLYTWVFNRARGSVLLAMLMHAASNAASGWLTTLLHDTQLAPPETGWVGYIAAHQWLNVIAFGLAATILIGVTRGRLGYQPQQLEQPFAGR